jgi:hypothetical protein
MSCGHIPAIHNEEICLPFPLYFEKNPAGCRSKQVRQRGETIKAINPDLILADKSLGWTDGCSFAKN